MAKGLHEKPAGLKYKNKKENKKENENGKAKSSKKFHIANICAVLSVFIGITVFLIVGERPTESQTEKRELNAFPEFSLESLFSGEYTSDIALWFGDTVPFRDSFKSLSSNITKAMGVSLGGVTVHGTPNKVVNSDGAVTDPPQTTAADNTQEPEETSDTSSAENTSAEQQTSADETTDAQTETEASADNGLDGVVDADFSNGQIVFEYQGHTWGVSLYGGGYNQDKYIKSVNDFAEDLDGIANVYSMIAPTNGDFYCPNNFSEYNASQYDDIAYIESNLSDKVTSVNCYSALQQHKDEEIYFRTDHHWQPLGAYYAAEQFAKAAEVPFLELNEDNFEYCEIENFVGSVYSYTEDPSLKNDPDVLKYYIPKNDFSTYYYNTHYEDELAYPFFQKDQQGGNAYCVFMGGDAKIVRVDTDVDNGRTLLVFKDSYGNAEIPFYMNSFEHIYVCDVRFFPLNAIDFIKEHGVTDVLFTMNIFSAVGGNADGIELCRTGEGPLLDWGQD